MAAAQKASGAYLVMPLLITSMGGEMIYILEQRLDAQKISEHKGQKVLYDVIRSMFFPRFIQELFKPQEMFSMASTRQIFDRLAHSSIMRLNESSMDKLIDLMTMGYKYQFLCCSCGEDIVDVALNHIDATKKIASGNQEILNLILQCEALIHSTYDEMSPHDFRDLRMQLASFFQDRRVKVSLFLQDETQNYDGSIVIPLSGDLAFNVGNPGTITYLQQDARAEVFGVANRDCYTRNEKRIMRVNITPERWTTLGTNLYSKDRSGKAKNVGAAGDPAGASGGLGGLSGGASRAAPNKQNPLSDLNSLAALINVPKLAEGPTEIISFDNFFGNDIFIDKNEGPMGGLVPGAGGLQQVPGAHHQVHQFKNAHAEHACHMEHLRTEFDQMNVQPGSDPNAALGLVPGGTGGNPAKTEEEDLLDLLG